jgi:hypothetical protein
MRQPKPKRFRCPVCGNKFTPNRSDAVTCSHACRQKAYRQRQNPPTRAAPKRSAKPAQTKKTRSGKGTRGGAGRNQGRKKVLTYEQMFLVGATCEELWQQLKEQKTLEKYRNQPHVKDIRQERAPLRDAPRPSEGNDVLAYARRVAARRQERALISQTTIDDVAQGIDEIVEGRGRFTSIPPKRPKGKREQIKREAIRWCHRTYGIVVSPRRIQACWEEYRKWERNQQGGDQ